MMNGPQRQRDYEGSRTQDTAKSGKKKPPFEQPLTAQEMAEQPISEIATTFVELDRQAEELAPEHDELSAAFDEEEYEEEHDDEDKEYGNSEEDLSTETVAEDQAAQTTGSGPAATVPVEQKGLAQTEPDKEFIDEAVAEINSIALRTVEQGALEIGMWVLKHIFKGDIKLASSKSPRKDRSFAMLSDHPRLRINPRRLSDYLRAAAIRTHAVGSGLELPNATVSHYLESLAVDDEKLRLQLLIEADSNKLSVRDFRKRILEINPKKRVPEKVINQLMHKIKDPHALPVGEDFEKLIEDEEFLKDDLSKKERLNLRAEIETKRDHMTKCGEFLDLLEQRLAEIDL
jgi:hypothetical protein